ncbi:hypothetical protein DMH27_00990 [Raoultella planticola]|nr:hypothetical protein [Raoultella planticola]
MFSLAAVCVRHLSMHADAVLFDALILAINEMRSAQRFFMQILPSTYDARHLCKGRPGDKQL